MAEVGKLIKNAWQKHKQVLLWALGGGVNTLLTYGLYLAFNLIMAYPIAYSASYVIGIVLSFFYNSLVVFHSPLSFKKFALFPVVYLVQYLLSLGLLTVFVQLFMVSETLAPIFVLAISLPVTYLLSRLILKGKDRAAEDELQR
jgi:putative flippase GtrA